MSSRRYVLDSNALTGWLEEREGTAGKMENLLEEAIRQDIPLLMSAVNWGEVFYVAWRRHGEATAWATDAKLRDLPIAIIAADYARATRAAALKQKHNLGYADSFAAELAIERGARLVTADPEFAKIGKSLVVYPLPRHAK